MKRSAYIIQLYNDKLLSLRSQDLESWWYITGFLKSLDSLDPQTLSNTLYRNAFRMGWEDAKDLRDQDEFYGS